MKLIWITPECPYPANTGGRSGVWNRIKNMANNNEIYLFCIAEDKDYIYKEDIDTVCKSVNFYKRQKSFLTYLKSLSSPYPAVSRWNKKLKNDVTKCYLQIKPDYIIVDFPQMIGNIDKEILLSHKVVLCQHNIEFMTLKNIATGLKFSIKKLLYYIVSKQLENYENKLYKDYDFKLITFVSMNDKKFFEEKYNNYNTLLVPVGATIKEEVSNKGKDIIFVAKMSYPPNENAAIWFLKNVWNSIYEKHPKTHFYIVGKDPSQKLIDYANTFKNVIVTGTIDSVDKYYDLARIVVVPLFNGGGVKVKLLEALGYGKLVITTSKGIEGTDFINNTHLLVADTELEFIKKCNDVLDNYDQYKEILINAKKKMISEYSWEKVVRDFENKLIDMEKENE